MKAAKPKAVKPWKEWRVIFGAGLSHQVFKTRAEALEYSDGFYSTEVIKVIVTPVTPERRKPK